MNSIHFVFRDWNKNPAAFIAKGELKVEGSRLKFLKFLGMFDGTK